MLAANLICTRLYLRTACQRRTLGGVLHGTAYIKQQPRQVKPLNITQQLSNMELFLSMQGAKGGGQISLLNIITELKKCCNHPFLFESAEADFRGSSEDSKAVDRLVVSAGKMVLLDKLLRRLKETGHRYQYGSEYCNKGLGSLPFTHAISISSWFATSPSFRKPLAHCNDEWSGRESMRGKMFQQK